MPSCPSSRPATDASEFDRLTEVVETLGQRVQLLQEALDDLREDFRWALDNNHTVVWPTVIGLDRIRRNDNHEVRAELLRVAEASPAVSPLLPVLRQLIEDVQLQITDIATEQLEYMLVELGHAEQKILDALTPPRPEPTLFDASDESSSKTSETAADDPTEYGPVLPYSQGDVIRFRLDEHDYTGEVVQIDVAAGKVDICRAPTMDIVSIDLDVLVPLESHEPHADDEFWESHRLLTLFEVGEAVEFAWDEEELFGEIVTVDDAHSEATVMLIPSQDEITVPQDILTKVSPDPLSYAEADVLPDAAECDAGASNADSRAADCCPAVASPPVDTTAPDSSSTASAPNPPRPASPVEPPDDPALRPPMTIQDLHEFRGRLLSGAVTLVELCEAFDWLVTSHDVFIQELVNAYDLGGLKRLALTLGCETREKQRRLVALRIYEALLRGFLCGRRVDPSVRSPMLELLISHNLDRLSDDAIAEYANSHSSDPPTDSARPSPTLF